MDAECIHGLHGLHGENQIREICEIRGSDLFWWIDLGGKSLRGLRVADRDRQCVSSVLGWFFGKPEHPLHHFADLQFLCAAVTDDALLHAARCVFENFEAIFRRREQSRAARLARKPARNRVVDGSPRARGGSSDSLAVFD